MGLAEALRSYAAHPDPVTAGCNRIALLVASSQPLYPVYVLWIVGGDWQVSFWTFLSTPFFSAVPAVARWNATAGRVLLVVTGIVNGVLSAKAFGVASGVEWFLLPCLLISILAFRHWPRTMLVLMLAIAGAASLHKYYGAPLGNFTTDAYVRFTRLNLYSVAVLSGVILWTLTRARLTNASR